MTHASLKKIAGHVLQAIVLGLLLAPSVSQAAHFHLEPQEKNLGTEGDFAVVVLLDSQKPVNTVSVSLVFPKDLEPKDVETGESVINLWIDKPVWNETTRTLSFSGIIPGGLTATDAPLVTVDCSAVNPGASATVSFDPASTRAYLSDGKGTQDGVSFENLLLPVTAGKENIAPAIPDTTAPEAFTPEVSRSAAIFDDQWFLSFSTEDKGGGVAFYEVKEQRGGIFALFPSEWKTAESPYLLADQALRSGISVKAVDKAGNVRLETVPARYPLPWYESAAFWIILIIVFLLYAAIRYKKIGKVF